MKKFKIALGILAGVALFSFIGFMASCAEPPAYQTTWDELEELTGTTWECYDVNFIGDLEGHSFRDTATGFEVTVIEYDGVDDYFTSFYGDTEYVESVMEVIGNNYQLADTMDFDLGGF